MLYSNKTHVILTKGEVSTSNVSILFENYPGNNSTLVFFKKGDPKHIYGIGYCYNKSNITILDKPQVFNPQEYSFKHNGEELNDVYVACKFQKAGTGIVYWTIGFLGPREDLICKGEEITICSKKQRQKNNSPLDYLTAMSYFHGDELRNDYNPEPLGAQYRLLKGQKEAPLLKAYIKPEGFVLKKDEKLRTLISPFGLNKSQLTAIRNALSNRISVIQGPPGTGKTQTILNILANLVINGKTALVVAGSNAATDNIYEKLEQYKLDFLVARLGSKEKIEIFKNSQRTSNLCKSSWNTPVNLQRIASLTEKLEPLFEKNAEKHRAIQEGRILDANTIDLELSGASFENEAKQLTDLSMKCFLKSLWNKYHLNTREKYDKDSLSDEQKCIQLLKDYPIVLSTAFSAKNNIHKDVLFDYVILDEASQIDVATGALALSCARNAVVVGDLKQLPNVIPGATQEVANKIFRFYDIPERFNYAYNNFLQSVCKTFRNLPEVVLREHYRCHPKIAAFFNHEFYNDELIIMTRDKGEEDTLILRTTVPGNHAILKRNGREEAEIEDIKADYNIYLPTENYGIIAPYNNQVRRIAKDKDIEEKAKVSTVHKFQGQERDTIIISTVDNIYSEFVNDPQLLNVAVSRARKRLILVTNGNEGNTGYLKNLVDYMKAKGKVEKGELTSLFDMLNDGQEEKLKNYLSIHPKMPKIWFIGNEPASRAEEIAYCFITDVLKDFPGLDVGYEAALDDLIPEGGYAKMDDKEKKYSSNPDTHIDFLISRKFEDGTTVPILAIEIDGETYHIDGSPQDRNDKMKDRIVQEVCGLRMLRMRTKDSVNEFEILKQIISHIE